MPSKKVTTICLLVPLVFVLFVVMGVVDAGDDKLKCYSQSATQDNRDLTMCDKGQNCYVATKCKFNDGTTNDLRGCAPIEAEDDCSGMTVPQYGNLQLTTYCEKCRVCNENMCNGGGSNGV